MTYTEWAATVERGVTITPQMAFAAGAASVKQENVPVWEYRCGAASRDAEIAELVAALEHCKDWFDASGLEVPASLQANESLDKVRKST